MNRYKSIFSGMRWLVYRVILFSVGGIAVISVTLYKFLHGKGIVVDNPSIFALCVLAACAIVGVIITIPLSKHFLKPLSELISATDAVANGNYSVRIPEETAIGEFRSFIQSFNKMAESLSGAEMLRTDFVNTISHEFKTPVVSIRGFARLLQKEDLTQEQRRLYTDTIIAESERLSSMSANILLLSYYDNLPVIPDRRPYRLDEQLRDCIRQQERAWLKKDIALSGELEPVTYVGNEDIMAHLWSNLLSNAVKFTPEGGEIVVTLTEREGLIRVSFRDSGPGMDGETLLRIYDKFYQADRSRNKDGNGLGLSIVRRIVNLCGGAVDAVSAPGEGSEFTVTLRSEEDASEK